MNKYRHLFFDLDRTLWDFDSNSKLTLEEIFDHQSLIKKGIESFSQFFNFYHQYNHELWDLYKLGKLEKEYLRVQRFRGTLEHFNIYDDELASKIADDYVKISPTKTKLFPDTLNVLEELIKKYNLHIITNGFNEVQFIKLKNSGLSPFFQQVITSEMLGVQKPNAAIFSYSMEKAGAKLDESIMIGDDQATDIIGAQNIGMDQVFVDYHQENLICKPTFHVQNLKKLLDIL